MLFPLGAATIARNQEWNDPKALYTATVDNAQYAFRANNNLGVEHFRAGDLARAEYYFKKSLDVHPHYAPALNNMGTISLRKKNIPLAVEYFKKSKENDPGYLLAYRNLAEVYLATGNTDEGKQELQEILNRFPHDQPAREMLRGIKD